MSLDHKPKYYFVTDVSWVMALSFGEALKLAKWKTVRVGSTEKKEVTAPTHVLPGDMSDLLKSVIGAESTAHHFSRVWKPYEVPEMWKCSTVNQLCSIDKASINRVSWMRYWQPWTGTRSVCLVRLAQDSLGFLVRNFRADGGRMAFVDDDVVSRQSTSETKARARIQQQNFSYA